MLKRLCDWFDDRTGYRKLMQAMLLEHIPGGAKWRYVWGSTLAFVFMLQVVTGVLLMTAYSPGNSTAWGSVYYIQYEMEFGWLIRGLHHFGSGTMVVLLGIHMLQVVIAGAHLPPREVNWWLGLLLMGLVLGMSLTGYLLPWDQKGYWATQVATSILGGIPGVGDTARTILIGGPDYGNHTLSRFYALHVAIIPAMIVILLVAHVAVFRRHGVTAPKDAQGEGLFWPDQAFRDMVVCMLIFGTLLAVVIFGSHGYAVDRSAFANERAEPETVWNRVALAGRDGAGAPLDAPADPGQAYPARPEWYFLFLFQLLKYFQGDDILIGTVFIPNGVMLALFILPLFGRGWFRPIAHALGVIGVVGVLAGAASLTCLAVADDTADPESRALLQRIGTVLVPLTALVFLVYLGLLAVLRRGRFRQAVSVAGGVLSFSLLVAVLLLIYGAKADALPEMVREAVRKQMTDGERKTPAGILAFRNQLEHAEESSRRALRLAADGIPAEGAVLLLHRDPMTTGKELFKQHCAVCHSWGYDAKTGLDDFHHDPKQKPIFKAADLKDFGNLEAVPGDASNRTRFAAWIHGLLKNPADDIYFGRTNLEGMKKWKKGVLKAREKALKKNAKEAEEAIRQEEDDFATISEYLAQQALPPGQRRKDLEVVGLEKFEENCASCHPPPGQKRPGSAPSFTGYGDPEWLRLMIMAPADPLRHGTKNEMPAFRALDGPGAEVHRREFLKAHEGFPENMILRLSDVERELIIRFMARDGRAVFGGATITGPPKR